ncbi:MAG: PhoX family phosphatase [Marinovum algicola]|uniref:PhoX family protein n=1 Tax=Marinovum algicola TaxID=42444 RepID=UPI0032EC0C69
MTDIDRSAMSADDWDELNFPRPEVQDFDRVVDRALSRRGFMGGVLAFGSGAAVMGTSFLKGGTAMAQPASRFPFTPIAAQTDNTIHVPEGYSWDVLVRWGDPLFSDADGAFDPSAGVPVEMSDRVFGENTDGMELYNIDGREIIVVNSEYTNRPVNLPHAPEGVPTGLDDVRMLQHFQGVSVMEIAQGENGWSVVVDSPFNRRIHHNTPMTFSGPAAGHELLQTADDPTGMASLGTFNNCGSGRTPWGTYLTCEENFNGYFGATGEMPEGEGYSRYGIGGEGRYAYETFDPRYDISQEPNEPHRHGFVTEIDPADPASTPIKRTALGRIKHENAAMTQAADGRVVVYMGDDERGEFLYKYVSNGTWEEGQDGGDLLNDGTLYVAKFNDDMTGEWLALTPETTGMALPEILAFTRMAASAAGGTTMDRPEWVAVNPVKPEAYVALTNNSRRGEGATNAGGDDMSTNAANPRETNNFGQIARWTPADGNHAAEAFTWDLYVMAGNPAVYDNAYAGSENVTEGNMFNSPDGMIFSSDGMLWIQTDGDDDNEGDFAGMGNNQMLVGNPETGEIARFMTVPNGAEVTGLCFSLDKSVAFVGVQHPGGAWPDGEGAPRSSIVAVWREDGATIG